MDSDEAAERIEIRSSSSVTACTPTLLASGIASAASEE
jgi:hypothetical protein